MRNFPFLFPRAYRLKPVAQREDDALSLLRIGRNKPKRRRTLFAGSGLCRRPEPGRGLPISGDDFRVETLV
jgi:hypothetical protein